MIACLGIAFAGPIRHLTQSCSELLNKGNISGQDLDFASRPDDICGFTQRWDAATRLRAPTALSYNIDRGARYLYLVATEER